jgi:hypothetical protein
MKNIIYKMSAAATGIVLLVSSCTKKIDEAYTNPNADVRVPIETLLPGIIGNFVGSSAAAGSAYGIANDGLLVGRYVQFWATNTTGNQFDQMGGATAATDNLGSLWAMHYFGMGGNVSKMIEWGIEEKKWDYVGVGYAIRAWGWLTLTNHHGEIIVHQAFDPNRLVFAFDPQEEAYKESRRACMLALEYLNMTGDGASPANLAIGDAWFNQGDVNKWKKFVYGTLARSFHHLTNKAEYKPDSVIHYAKLAMQVNADNADAEFQASGVSGKFNYYGPFRANAGNIRQSRFVANLMSGLNPMFLTVTDPRTPYLLRENTLGTYKGVRPNKGADGLPAAEQPQNFWGGAFSSTAAPGNDNNARFIFRNAAPFPIMTAAEMQFLMAEAYFRQGLKEDARTAYITGIGLHFDMLTGTPEYHNSVPASLQMDGSDRTAYLANPLVVPAAPNLTLSHIMLQKYIALFGWGMHETWTDMRRYHYTDLDPITGLQVYADFTPPTGLDLFTNNNGKLVYRARPRFNSEYLYNVDELNRIGAIALDYNTKEQWFSQP